MPANNIRPVDTEKPARLSVVPAVSLQMRLLLAGAGLVLIGTAGLWSYLRAEAPQAVQVPTEVPTYPFSYNRLMADQTIEVKAAPKRAAVANLYLWTADLWQAGKALDEVKARLVLSGMSVEPYPAKRKGHYHFRLGPFTSVSERNNARQNLFKQNLTVRITAPPTGQ